MSREHEIEDVQENIEQLTNQLRDEKDRLIVLEIKVIVEDLRDTPVLTEKQQDVLTALRGLLSTWEK